MPNKFQHISDYLGLNIGSTPDNIGDLELSDCNNVDLSMPGTVSVLNGRQIIGNDITGTSYDIYKSYLFKKSFGTQKSVPIRVRGVSTGYVIEYFNQRGTSIGGVGQWELINKQVYTSGEFGFATGNGDDGQSINRLFLSNAVSDPLIWDGSTATVMGVDDTTLYCWTDLLSEGFANSFYTKNGDTVPHILINGIDCTFTGISGDHFLNVSATIGGVYHTVADLYSLGLIHNNDGITTIANSTLTKNVLINNNNTISYHQNIYGDYLSRSDGGSFETDGFLPGQKIFVTGFTGTKNNGIFTINNFDTSGNIVLTRLNAGVNESAANSIVIAAGIPKGNILRVDNGRLYVAGITGQESTMQYSATNDLTIFMLGTADKLDDPGWITIFNGGNRINAIYPRGNNSVLVHKDDGIFQYNLSVNSSGKSYASLDSIALGNGVGAANNESIMSYDKSMYFVNGFGAVKMMETSIYSSNTFSFTTINTSLKKLGIRNPKMIYDATKDRIVISFSDDQSRSMLLSLFIAETANGKTYKPSFSNYTVTGITFNMPILFAPSDLTFNGLWLSLYSNTYRVHGGDNFNSSDSVPYIVSKEYTFNEPASDKALDIINLDGYILDGTTIRVSILYGHMGREGTKHMFIDKNTSGVEKTLLSNFDYKLNGLMSIFNGGYDMNNFKNSYRFSIPIHIDSKKSTRYKIRVETYYDQSRNKQLYSTWWALNNISTNPTLYDVNMNNIVNQNEISTAGIGTDIVSITNKVE